MAEWFSKFSEWLEDPELRGVLMKALLEGFVALVFIGGAWIFSWVQSQDRLQTTTSLAVGLGLTIAVFAVINKATRSVALADAKRRADNIEAYGKHKVDRLWMAIYAKGWGGDWRWEDDQIPELYELDPSDPRREGNRKP